jgi:nicotinamide-nucleotide amidase
MASRAAEILRGFEQRGLYLAVAESLTGGLLTAEFVSVPGASKVLLGGVVAYQTDLKHELLGVSRSLLQMQGAVDPEVAAQMAGGVREKLGNKCGKDEAAVVGIATTGVAGPDTQDGKPVGQTFVAISGSIGEFVYAHEFAGDREAVRQQAVNAALEALWEHFG